MTPYTLEPFVNDPREVRDLLAISGLWSNGACEHRLRDAIAASDAILAARCPRGELVGIARTLTDNAVFCLLAMLVVHPSHRGGGLGRELATRVTHNPARAAGITTIVLSESAALSFYEELGFKSNGALLMRQGV
jgi:N-acetylglutamate synthase-like GNAT family acetyltransferase